MSTTSNIASPLRRTSLPRKQIAPFIPPAVVTILAALTLLAIGIFTGVFITNRIINAKIAYYGTFNMNGASVLINVMDDLAPYLAITILVSVAGMPLTLAAWTWSRPMPRALRIAATGVLAILVLFAIVVLGFGRSAPGTVVPPMTPTPTP